MTTLFVLGAFDKALSKSFPARRLMWGESAENPIQLIRKGQTIPATAI